MTHPAVDQEVVELLRRRAGAVPTDPSLAAASAEAAVTAVEPATTAERFKARARQVATPVVERVRHELDRATAGEVQALRSELDELRAEVNRLRSEQAAALAALAEDRR